MSDSLENMVDTQNEITQPGDVVATNPEETTQPQGGDVETEFYVETEVDQQTATNESDSQSDAEIHARWLKERDKRKRKNEELEAEKRHREEIQRKYDDLQARVAGMERGAPPTLESCDYDEALLQQKMREYYQPKATSNQQEEPVSNQAPQQSNPQMDAAEFYLYQKEQALSKKLPDYEQNKSELIGKIKQFGGNEQTMIGLSNIAQQANIDIAKATVALNKNPGLLVELNQAAASGSQFAIADVLKKAESKVQTRQRKPIDTHPEPTINSSGPIDNKAKAVQKAFDSWKDETNPHKKIQLWNNYQALKKSN